MISNSKQKKMYPFLKGGGEMGELTRNYDWSSTPLGAPDEWPHSLRVTVSNLLSSRFPMFLWWGKEMIQFYNDAYRPSLGNEGKHPVALGQKGKDCWPEIWHIIYPLIQQVQNTGIATWQEDQLVPIYRNGKIEDVYWTYSYSSVLDEAGKHAGILVTCVETTGKVLANNRIANSEQNLRNIILQAPVAMCILSGKNHVVEIANDRMFELWGTPASQLLGKSIFEGLPAVKGQGFEQLLDGVYKTGNTYKASGIPVQLPREGKVETTYINFVYEAYRDDDNTIKGVMVVATDVTEQVLANKKIENSEQQVRSLVDSAPFPIGVYTGKEMRIMLANEAILKAWGRSDVIGKCYAEVLPELDNQQIFEQLDQVYNTGKPFHARNQRVDLVVDDKLQPFYFNYSFTPLFDQEGNVYGIMNTAADVTDLNVALQKVKEAEEKTRLAIESASLGTYEMSYFKDDLDSSSRLNEIFGKANMNTRVDYVSAIHPDDQSVRKKAHKESLQTGRLQYEARILVNNETRWIRVSGRVLFNEGHEAERLIGVVQDITAQKQFAAALSRQVSERTAELEQAKQTLQSSHDYLQDIINKFETALASLVPVFENGEIVDFTFNLTNHAYSTYSMMTPEALHGKKISDVFPGYKNTDAFEKYKDTYLTGKINKWDLHYNQDHLNVYLSIVASKMNEEVIVHLTDFTNLKSLQFDLLKYIEELQRSNKNLEDFAYAASHDLKEPIRKILFFADMLKHEISKHLSADQVNLFEKLIKATTRMGTLVDDLLAYSQVNTKITTTENINMNNLVDVVLNDLEYEIAQKQATIKVSKLFSFTGHQRQLQQAFQNLIGNSLKYAQPGKPVKIEIDYEKIKGSNTGLLVNSDQLKKHFHVISISDNGIGFDQEDAGRIFNVFTRLHGNAQFQGSGIGLSIVRKVINNHQGYIIAESKPNEGALFKVYLPA